MKVIEDLSLIAEQAMRKRGLEPHFSSEEMQQLASIAQPAAPSQDCIDLRAFPWCSIDNDTSRDLDQLTYAEKDVKTTFWVAVADVDVLVKKDTPIDTHARINTTSVYTPAKIFSMLPEKLSTNFTSLNVHEDRVAMVIKIELTNDGGVDNASVFRALVRNQAQLTYNGIGSWLEGKTPLPANAGQVPGLENTLRIQHAAAQLLKQKRHAAGALTLETPEVEFRIVNQQIQPQPSAHNYADQLIEEFMVAANRAVAQHLREANIPSLRRVVRTPKYWGEIVEVAKKLGEQLPLQPDAKSLDAFLEKRRQADPEAFPDLSLTIVKLLGRGEYVVETGESIGHFALALKDYTHFTAPNRRFPDLISQRQYKAYLRGEKSPYTLDELQALAAHCTRQEDAATKVERQLNKSAAAVVLSDQIGKHFQGIITGTGAKGTWVRIFQPPVEGKIIRPSSAHKVGDKVAVKLIRAEISNGFIDFAEV